MARTVGRVSEAPWAGYLAEHDADEPPPFIDAQATETPPAPSRGDCPEPGCDWTYKPGTTNKGRDLGAHRKAKHGIAGQSAWSAGKRRGHKVPRDQAPPSVRVDIRAGARTTGAKSDPTLDAVERRAAQLVGTIAAVLYLVQQVDDAKDLQGGKDAWAKSVRDLAVHEEWLRKLMGQTGGDASERFLAYISFVMSTVAMLLPVLVRHGAVPPAIFQFLSAVPVPAPAAAEPETPHAAAA